jgi:4'-phosphopantetheinyl transferase EntD
MPREAHAFLARPLSTDGPAKPLGTPALRSFLGPDFAVAVATPALADDELYPEEREHIRGAVEKRRAEFGTARICARRALAELGIGPIPLVPYGDRSPRWPYGIVGSISHTVGHCVAAVTKSPKIRAFGIDVENHSPLAVDLERMICTPAERAHIADSPACDRGRIGKMFFSAKEAVYKCQYPLTRTLLDFRDVELSFEAGEGAFAVRRVLPRGERWQQIRAARGRFLLLEDAIVSVAILYKPDVD